VGTKIREGQLQSRTPIVLIHDAAIDEFISTMLLTVMPGVDLLGIIIVNADCLAVPAMEAASKLQQFLGRADIPIALSRARGWNAFPWPYRGDCVAFADIPSLQPFTAKAVTPPRDGELLLETLLAKAIKENNPLTLLMTGPMTPLTKDKSRSVVKSGFYHRASISRLLFIPRCPVDILPHKGARCVGDALIGVC